MNTTNDNALANLRGQMSGAALEVAQPILDATMAQAERVARGLGGELAWPRLLLRSDRIDPGFRD